MADRRDRTPADGKPATASSPERLGQFARAALTGSNDDRAMFLGTCRRYAYAIALRLGRRHHGAEDSAQDATKAVWELLERHALKPETIRGFIGTIVLRDAYAAAQRRLREATIAGHSTREGEVPDTAVEVETAEWAQRVRDAVDALPEPLRRLVALRHSDGCSLDEIAQLLGTSRRTISRQLRDAEAALRDALRDLDEPDAGPERRADAAGR